ncbi:MAG TPA: M48 family metallopeptidase [Verrucomicrobiae bacterium]|nr:M48 family metallopeptidase [Verrucomicrobiae bacterium]
MSGTVNPDYSILDEFKGTIVRPKTGLLYHACLLLVAGAMLILPLIYLVMLGALAWVVYYHAVYDWTPIMHFGDFTGGGRVMIVKFLIYFVPLFAGVVVLFFMVKPLLAGRPKRAQPLAMNPADNPLLYAFIAKICDIVGAPAPKRIDMDCQLNASASFHRGFRGMMGNDLVLTIGLPLVANLSTRELAGVIAHEFGHFTQGAGMRLCYVIRSINFWFARVAYQRDAWDEALENWSSEVRDGRVAILVWSVQIAVWFSRLILKLLMLIGHILAGFMLRQMEYDADAWQIKVVGSETFEATHRKLATLEAALAGTYQQIRMRWKKDHHLPDNLSELLRQTHESLPPAVLQKIDDTLGFHRTSLFDSHPSPADRIRRGRMSGEAGIFHNVRPASSLFASFEHPARFVTLLHYTDHLGIPVTSQMLLHVESTQPKAAQGYAAAANSPADDFFLGVLPLLMPLRLATPAPSANYEADLAELNQLSASLRQISARLAPIAEQYTDASRKLIQARAAQRLLDAGVPIQPDAFGLGDATPESAQAAETEAAAGRDDLRHSLREVAAALNRRMQLGLAIGLCDAEKSDADSGSLERVRELASVLNRAADDYANHLETMDALAVFDRVVAVTKSAGETPALSQALDAQKKIVNAFVAESPGETKTVTIRPALQLARRQSHLNSNEIESLRQNSLRWFVDYRKMVDQLVEMAVAAGGISG